MINLIKKVGEFDEFDINVVINLPFDKSEVFHVVDTLHNGVVGSWQALRYDFT